MVVLGEVDWLGEWEGGWVLEGWWMWCHGVWVGIGVLGYCTFEGDVVGVSGAWSCRSDT